MWEWYEGGPYDDGVDTFCVSTDRVRVQYFNGYEVEAFFETENLILCSWQNAFSRKIMHLIKVFCTRNIVNILPNMSPMTGNELRRCDGDKFCQNGTTFEY